MSDSDTAKSTQTQETAPASSTETPVSATEDPTVVIPREGAQYNAEQCKEKLTASMEEMFAAMGDYARAELSSVTKDFALLQELNEAASHKYDGMAETATKLSVFLEDLQAHYKILEPYLKQVDELDAELTELESTVQGLDEYTKKLEVRFRKISKVLGKV